MVAGGRTLKVFHSDRVILKKKKRMRGYYNLVESREAQCEVELREPSGAQSEVELQEEVDRARDKRFGKTRGDVAR